MTTTRRTSIRRNHDGPGRAFHLLASGPVLVRLLQNLGGPLFFLAGMLLIKLYQVLAHGG